MLRRRLLELSLPKFSLSRANDLRELLRNMDAEVEDKLLGSQAQFSQLANTDRFTINKVCRGTEAASGVTQLESPAKGLVTSIILPS